MLIRKSIYSPTFAFWTLDQYPYYLASIQEISQQSFTDIDSPDISDGNDKILFIKDGTADISFIDVKSSGNKDFSVSKYDLIFTAGGTRYTINNYSSNICVYKIHFKLYTCSDVHFQSQQLNIENLTASPVENRRLFLIMPPCVHLDNENDATNILDIFFDEYKKRMPGYTIKLQTLLIQLVLSLMSKSSKDYDEILCNANLFALSSLYSSNTILPEGCRLNISNIEIISNESHSKENKAEVLSIFDSQNNSIQVDSNYLTVESEKEGKNTIEISTTHETEYHVWLYRKSDSMHNLIPYKNTAYIKFKAKCNMKIDFGIVIYNGKIDKCINHNISVSPSDDFTEFCIPLIPHGNDVQLNPYIHDIINYIENNYSNKIKLEDIAKNLHLNPSYISYMFKEKMGITISQYIMNYRLNLSQQLFKKNPALSTLDVALYTGFCDTAHFSKCFKRAYGITVTEYKQGLNKNVHDMHRNSL